MRKHFLLTVSFDFEGAFEMFSSFEADRFENFIVHEFIIFSQFGLGNHIILNLIHFSINITVFKLYHWIHDASLIFCL